MFFLICKISFRFSSQAKIASRVIERETQPEKNNLLFLFKAILFES